MTAERPVRPATGAGSQLAVAVDAVIGAAEGAAALRAPILNVLLRVGFQVQSGSGRDGDDGRGGRSGTGRARRRRPRRYGSEFRRSAHHRMVAVPRCGEFRRIDDPTAGVRTLHRRHVDQRPRRFGNAADFLQTFHQLRIFVYFLHLSYICFRLLVVCAFSHLN